MAATPNPPHPTRLNRDGHRGRVGRAVALRAASPLTQAGKPHLPGLVAGLTCALFASPVLALIWNDLSSTRINSHSNKQPSVAVEGTIATGDHSDIRGLATA
jgi:hypothetical protein